MTAKPLQEEIGELQQKLEALPKVTAAEVKALEQLQNEVNTKETELQGMKLLAQLSVKTPQTISVSSPLAQPETAAVTTEAAFSGAGSLEISAEEWTLKVQAGQCDVEAILEQIAAAKALMQEQLQQLALADLPAVRQMLEKRRLLLEQMSRLQAKLEGVLQGSSYPELAAAVEDLTETMTRDPETVLTELLQLQADLKQAEEQLKAVEERLTAWEQAYGSHEAVMDRVIEIRTERSKRQQELAS